MEEKTYWVFRNHLGELRYIVGQKPIISKTYETKIVSEESIRPYHGSGMITVRTYGYDIEKPYEYYSEYQIQVNPLLTSRELKNLEPEILGVHIPDILAREDLKVLKFSDGPMPVYVR